MATSALRRRLREFTGVALFAAALLWLISLLSYSPQDPVWFFNNVSGDAPANFAGRVGAFLAIVSLQLVGYAAFTGPLVLASVGWYYFWCQDIEAGYTKIVGACLMVASVAALLSLSLAPLESSARPFRSGGVLGHVVSAGLAAYLNRTGSAILLLTLMALSFALATQFSFGRGLRMLAAVIGRQRALLGRLADWREERRRELREERRAERC